MATRCPAPKANARLVLNPADLRNQVVIERGTDTKDAHGVVTKVYSTFATIWCSISPLSMRWQIQDGQPQTPGLFKIRARYLPGLMSTDRVNFGGRIMKIVEVLNIDERDIVHEITAQEQKDILG